MHLLIVDDEAPARDRLVRQLSDFESVSKVSTASNGLEAIAFCQRDAVEVVLLDIRMPGMDGIEAATMLQELPSAPAIIFTTAFDQYAVDAFETEAVGYLLKPVRRERLEAALEKASRISKSRLANLSRTTRSEKRFVSTRRQDELVVIPIEKILYFEADQKYTRAWHAGGDDLIDESLNGLETALETRFIRIHRKFLVNVRALRALSRTKAGSSEVRVAGSDAKLPVSRRHVAAVKRAITK